MGRPPIGVLTESFYYHWSMLPRHHVIVEEDDDMELKTEREDKCTYTATGMAISE
jgi:hypothetical protein